MTRQEKNRKIYFQSKIGIQRNRKLFSQKELESTDT